MMEENILLLRWTFLFYNMASGSANIHECAVGKEYRIMPTPLSSSPHADRSRIRSAAWILAQTITRQTFQRGRTAGSRAGGAQASTVYNRRTCFCRAIAHDPGRAFD